METIRIRPEAEIREVAASAFETHRRRILAAIPEAQVEHVGATAIPGALTKGDLDLLVRVDAARFDAAVAALRGLYILHQPENWTPTYASLTCLAFSRSSAAAVISAGRGVPGSVSDFTYRDASYGRMAAT